MENLVPNQGTRKSVRSVESAAYKTFGINALVETCSFSYILEALPATVSTTSDWGEPLR